jgi:transcriptional adapter 3
VPVTEFKDEFLFDEQKGLGSLTERIVAAMVADVDGASVKREETAGRPIPEHEVTKEPSRVDVFDLEDRMKKELRALMLLGEHEEVRAGESEDMDDADGSLQYDPSKRDDDEIASSLRQCQRLLLQQTAVNDARKTRLAEIARHRLAHGEYTNALEGIEKSIEAGWNKRVTKYKVTGKKNITPGTVPPLQSNRAPVPENLRRLVKVRQGWIENVGKLMKDRPKGEVNGLPTSSIYEGIGEDGGAEERDEKVVEDAMDIDSIADGEEVANGL